MKFFQLLILLLCLCSACGDSEVTTQQVRSLLDQGKFDEAVALSKQGTLQDPNEPEFYSFTGVVLFQNEEYAAALDQFAKAAELNPKNYKYQYNMGNAHRLLNNPEKALEHYSNAYKLKQNVPDIILNKALAELTLKQPKLALSSLEEHRKLVGQSNKFNNLFTGKALIMDQQFEEAIPFLQRAIAIDGEYAEAYFFLANAMTGVSGSPNEESCSYLAKSAEMEYTPAVLAFAEFCAAH